jgi:hypothetical protein
MKISTLAKLISLPLEAYEAALAYPFTEQMKKEGKRLCTQEALFLDYCRKQHQHRLFSLRLILELAADIKDDYDALGMFIRIHFMISLYGVKTVMLHFMNGELMKLSG